MSGGWRCFCYVVAWAFVGWMIMDANIDNSRAAYEAGDRSAYAWMGFLPFFLPIFWGRALVYIAVMAAMVELPLLIARRISDRND